MIRTLHDATARPPIATVRNLTIVGMAVVLALFSSTSPARADVGLGTAESFAVLAGQSVTNTNATTIKGDIGIHPGAAGANLTGAASITHTGTVYDTGSVALKAQEDLNTAYIDARDRELPVEIVPELDGADLGPGVYESTGSGAFLLSTDGVLTLTGNANDVWIFQSGSSLDFGSNSSIEFVGDVNACNVYWQVTSSATLGTGSNVVGTIMALTSISLLSGAELEGRALAINGSVTMDNNVIDASACVTAVTAVQPRRDRKEKTDSSESAQVEQVPTGPVAAGEGPSATGFGDLGVVPFVIALAVLVIAGALSVNAQRRGRS